MNSIRFPIVLLLMLSSLSAWGRSLELDVQDEVMRVNLANSGLKAMNGAGMELGWLYSEQDNNLYHLGLHVKGENWSKQSGTLRISLGGRIYGANPSSYSIVALALGGAVSVSPMKRVTLQGRLYYAPDISSVSDADGLRETELRLAYKVIPQASLFVGYRRIDLDIGNVGTLEVDESIHIGMRLLF